MMEFNKFAKRPIKKEKNIVIEYENQTENTNTFEEKILNKFPEITIDLKKASNHIKLVIEGIEIYFPFEPYDCQITYMTKVIQALNKGVIAGLESPTGTGKSLCLLCASLAWLNKKRSDLNKSSVKKEEINMPYIYYTSRTHSQLSNVIKELNKTCYKPRTALLSSRENLCVNSDINNDEGKNNINSKCKIARLRNQCKYFKSMESHNINGYNCIDIDEFKRIAEQSNFCPFYFQRRKKDAADIIFLPYNYIFNKKLLNILELNLKCSILLIDEAHNIEKVCEDSCSLELSNIQIDSCLEELNEVSKLLDKMNDPNRVLPIMASENKDKFEILDKVDSKLLIENKKFLINLKNNMMSLEVKQGLWPNIGKRFLPNEFFEIILRCKNLQDQNKILISNYFENPTPSSDSEIKNSLDSSSISSNIEFLKIVEDVLLEVLNKNSNIGSYIDFLILIKELYDNYLNLIEKHKDSSSKYIIVDDFNCFINNYKIMVFDEVVETLENNSNKNISHDLNNRKSLLNKYRKLSLFCLNPAMGFKHILDSGVISTIFTSGTLSPLSSMEAELKCEFKIKLENKHVIDNKQVKFAILTNSMNNKKINFVFTAKNKSDEMNEVLGYNISNLVKVSPPGSGVLCFFTSFSFMNLCFEIWSNTSIISEIEKTKEIFKDLQNDRSKNANIIRSFNDACSDGLNNKKSKGAILFSVLRSSSSEGIDFSDDKARMVIVVGIPYANLGDIKVNLKKEFLNDYAKKSDKKHNKKLTSDEWYTQDALKAVNQALGRVIRHTYDYGSIILIDRRYQYSVNGNSFSRWLKENHIIYNNREILNDIQSFFSDIKSFINKRKIEDRNKTVILNSNSNGVENFNCIRNKREIKDNLAAEDEMKDFCKKKISKKESISFLKNSSEKFLNISKDDKTSFFNNIILGDQNHLNINKLEFSQNNINQDFLQNKINRNSDPIDIKINTNEINKKPSDSLERFLSNSLNSYYKPFSSNMNYENIMNRNLTRNINNPNIKIIEKTLISNSESHNLDIPNDELECILSEVYQQEFYENEKIVQNVNEQKINFKENINSNEINLNEINFSELIKEEKSSYNIIKLNNSYNTFDSNDSLIYMNKMNIAKDSENINIPNESKIKISNNNYANNLNNISNKPINLINNLNLSIPSCPDIKDEDNLNTFTNLFNETQSEPIEKICNNNNFNEPLKKEIPNIMDICNQNSNSGNLEKIKNISDNSLIKTYGPLEDIDPEKLFMQLGKLKEKSNLDFYFKKYNIELPVKKEIHVERKYECPICFEKEGVNFKANKCGHILCSNCWKKVLKIKLECPICKKKINKKNLHDLYI